MRTWLLSGVVLLVGVLPTSAQTPTATKPKSEVDDAVAAALKAHPDVRFAEAERQMAEAKLDQARLLVAQRVTAAYAKVEQTKVKAEQLESIYSRMKNSNNMTGLETATYALQLQDAKAALAVAEADLLAAKGGIAVQASAHTTGRDTSDAKALLQALLGANRTTELPYSVPLGTGSTPHLRDLLGKIVKLDLKELDIPTAFDEVLKASGASGVSIRGASVFAAKQLKAPPKTQPFAGEQTFAAWLQMIVDDFNRDRTGILPSQDGKYELYVREYGLLFSRPEAVPADAVSLSSYLRQVRADKAELDARKATADKPAK